MKKKKLQLRIMGPPLRGSFASRLFPPKETVFPQELISFGKRSMWMCFPHDLGGGWLWETKMSPARAQRPAEAPQEREL